MSVFYCATCPPRLVSGPVECSVPVHEHQAWLEHLASDFHLENTEKKFTDDKMHLYQGNDDCRFVIFGLGPNLSKHQRLELAFFASKYGRVADLIYLNKYGIFIIELQWLKNSSGISMGAEMGSSFNRLKEYKGQPISVRRKNSMDDEAWKTLYRRANQRLQRRPPPPVRQTPPSAFKHSNTRPDKSGTTRYAASTKNSAPKPTSTSTHQNKTSSAAMTKKSATPLDANKKAEDGQSSTTTTELQAQPQGLIPSPSLTTNDGFDLLPSSGAAEEGTTLADNDGAARRTPSLSTELTPVVQALVGVEGINEANIHPHASSVFDNDDDFLDVEEQEGKKAKAGRGRLQYRHGVPTMNRAGKRKQADSSRKTEKPKSEKSGEDTPLPPLPTTSRAQESADMSTLGEAGAGGSSLPTLVQWLLWFWELLTTQWMNSGLMTERERRSRERR